jgi:Raf kinase inhibitor-like YbhB/YbcL family protein
MKINRGTLQIRSRAFEHSGPLPVNHSVDGSGVSPDLAWSGVPDGATTLALIVHDPDAPLVDGFVHWVLYGIPVGVDGIPEGAGTEFVQGVNSRGELGWTPAAPPPGHGTHHYFFHLYALDGGVGELPSGLDAQQLIERIDPHIINQARVVGTFRRDG